MCWGKIYSYTLRIYEIKRAIINLWQKKNTSIESYYTSLKKLWDELRLYQSSQKCIYTTRDLIQKYTGRDRLLEFFMGLNESYAQFHSNVLLMKPLPSVSEVYSMATQEERQRLVSPLYQQF